MDKIIYFLVTIIISAVSTVCFAAPITVDITAQVETVNDTNNILGGAISAGDIITGEYTYESTTLDSNAASTVEDYWHSAPPFGITINAGGFVFKTDPDAVNFLVEITNDHGSTVKDVYLLRSYNNLPLSNQALVDHITWQLDDPSATALASTDLPASPPTLGNWQSIFGLTITGSGPAGDPLGLSYFIRAHVTLAVLDTSTLTISPPSGDYVTTQGFDLVLILEADGLSIVGGNATLNNTDVIDALATCVIPGTLLSGGQTFRCPGLIGNAFGPGSHSLAITLALSDGSSVNDTVNWEIKENSEP